MSIATPTPSASRTFADRRPNPQSSFPNLAKAFLEVSAQARDQGLLKRAPWFYLILGAGLAIALLGAGTGFVLLGHSWWQLAIAAVLGILLTQVAFITHEAAHRTIFASGPRNDRLARLLASGVVGMSYSWWDSKHSRHHGNPNKVGKDPDIAMDTISFIEEDAETATGLKRWITQRQGWLFFPLLSLEGINLHYQGIKHLTQRGHVRGRWVELSLIAARFAIFLGLLFWLLPVGMAFAFLGVQLVVFGVYMGASFAPNHKGMPIIGANERLDFFSKQVRTSRNIRGGWWATVMFGGLNYQVEHHLFPNMARPYLARARKIVKAKCAELDVPYTETSLGRSYAIVVDYLNRVGLAARDPYECPMNGLRRG
jgi:fatty acid desaturase